MVYLRDLYSTVLLSKYLSVEGYALEPIIYYLFGGYGALFREVSIVLADQKYATQFYGMYYARTVDLEHPLFKNIHYISDFIRPPHQLLEPVDLGFLRDMEITYGLTISEMIHMDRHIMRLPPEQRMKLAELILKQFLDDIRNFKITLVVASALADLLSCFAHAYGKKTGLPVVHPVGARMGRNLCLSTTPNTGPYRYAEIYQSCYASFSENNELARPVREYIHQYISKRRQPHYVQGASSLLFRILSLADLGIMWKLWKLYLQDRYGLHYTTFPLWVPFQRVRRVYRAVMYSWFLRRHEINLEYLKERRYVIYPIHFHPEASTLVQGRFFNDQVRIVEMVSKALPADVTLVVKEHKVNVGRNPIGFYRKFLNFHNVRFITDKVSVYELINNAVGLVTICSSMGLEAMMCKKPVMVFGDVHYNLSKNVIRATDFTKMGAYFDDLVSHKFDEIDLWALIETTRSQMFETGDLNPDSKEAVHALAGAIVRFGSNP